MPIRVLAVGKVTSPWLTPCQEYAKRISRYDRLEVVELPELKAPPQLSKAAMGEHIRREGELLLKRLRPEEYVIALCIQGRQMSSEQLAQRLGELRVGGRTPCFVIGGSLGLSAQAVARADERLSFSAMTFPHQMARAVLLEQLYRAFKIINGERYHK